MSNVPQTPNSAATPCARELERNTAGLSFAPPLEAVFRQRYADLNVERYSLAIGCGIVLVFLLAALDLLTLDAAYAQSVALAKLAILLPWPLAALWISRHPRWYRWTGVAVTISVIAVSLGIICVHAVVGFKGVILPYDSLLLAVVFSYFISGLLWPWSAVAGVLVSLGCLVGEYLVGVDGGTLIYHALHLFAANIIGLLGSLTLERMLRMNFLHAGAAEELAGLDALTRMPNAAVFRQQLSERWAQAIEDQVSVGLLLVDIDYFQRYDQTAGHFAAERAVRRVAQCVRGEARSAIDVAARLDDDEFAMLIYAGDQSRLMTAARGLLKRVDALRLGHQDSPISRQLTVSIGAVIQRPVSGQSLDEFLERGHQALIAAKRGERHRIVFLPAQASDQAEVRTA